MLRVLRQVLAWIAGLAAVELMAHAVYAYRYEQGDVREFVTYPGVVLIDGWPSLDPMWLTTDMVTPVTSSDYPWTRIDMLVYTHVTAVVICAMLLLIVVTVIGTVLHSQTQFAGASVYRTRGKATTLNRTPAELVELSWTFLWDTTARCVAIFVAGYVAYALLQLPL